MVVAGSRARGAPIPIRCKAGAVMAHSLRIELSDEGGVWAWRLLDHETRQIGAGAEETADDALRMARQALNQLLDDGLEQSLRAAAHARSSLASTPPIPRPGHAPGRRPADGSMAARSQTTRNDRDVDPS